MLAISDLWTEEQADLQWHYSGVATFAAANRSAMQMEIARLNLIIPVLVLSIIALLLRKWVIILPVSGVIICGLAGACVTTVLVLGQLHVFTLVIGSILAGVAADYALHLLARDGELRAVQKPLLIGALSSVAGFLVFLLSDLPVLRQMAVFVASGLVYSAVTAIVFSRWFAALPKIESTYKQRLSIKRIWPIWILVVSGLSIGLGGLNWRDDLSDMEYPMPELRLLDQQVRATFGQNEDNAAIVIYAREREEMLQRLNEFLANLAPGLPIGPTVNVWLPSERQVHRAQSWLEIHGGEFETHIVQKLDEAGYDAEAFAPFFEDWATFVARNREADFFQCAAERFQMSLSGPLANLYPSPEQGLHLTTVLVPAKYLTDATIQPASLDGVFRLDTLSYLNALFASYRQDLVWYSAVGFALLTLIIALSFNTLSALLLISVPSIAALFISGLSWMAITLS
ncbi:MAG: hypothetical protein LR015_02690 [Verrucomicrobia bacterium]|nr:hypothetical protein [Verrucomicrobiota bacterium]